MLDVYRRAIHNTTLSGPTYFNEVLNKAVSYESLLLCDLLVRHVNVRRIPTNTLSFWLLPMDAFMIWMKLLRPLWIYPFFLLPKSLSFTLFTIQIFLCLSLLLVLVMKISLIWKYISLFLLLSYRFWMVISNVFTTIRWLLSVIYPFLNVFWCCFLIYWLYIVQFLPIEELKDKSQLNISMWFFFFFFLYFSSHPFLSLYLLIHIHTSLSPE